MKKKLLFLTFLSFSAPIFGGIEEEIGKTRQTITKLSPKWEKIAKNINNQCGNFYSLIAKKSPMYEKIASDGITEWKNTNKIAKQIVEGNSKTVKDAIISFNEFNKNHETSNNLIKSFMAKFSKIIEKNPDLNAEKFLGNSLVDAKNLFETMKKGYDDSLTKTEESSKRIIRYGAVWGSGAISATAFLIFLFYNLLLANNSTETTSV